MTRHRLNHMWDQPVKCRMWRSAFTQSNQLALCSGRYYNKIMKTIEVPYVSNVLAHYVLPEVAQVLKVVHVQV